MSRIIPPSAQVQIDGNEKDLFDPDIPEKLHSFIHQDDFTLFVSVVNRMALKVLQKPKTIIESVSDFFQNKFGTEVENKSEEIDLNHLCSIRESIEEFLFEENSKRWNSRGLNWKFKLIDPPVKIDSENNENSKVTVEIEPFGLFGLFLEFINNDSGHDKPVSINVEIGAEQMESL